MYRMGMSSDEPRARVVRAVMTDAQFKALRLLAVERDVDIRDLVTTALQTAPATRKVFA